MKHVNEVTLIGTVGSDAKITKLPSGDPCMSFCVATNSSWKNKNTDEWVTHTEWHNIVVFNKSLVDRNENKIKKGSPVYVKGEITTNPWTDKNGIHKDSAQIVLKSFKGELILLEKPVKKEASSSQTDNDVPFDDDVPF
jgi:single-strand DNA-binding protein